MSKVRIITRLETFIDVDAVVFGQWAAHRAVDSDCETLCDDWYSVTMVPSGRCIGSCTGMMGREDAVKLAEALSMRIPHIDNWRKTSDETRLAIRAVVNDVLPDEDTWP